MREDRRARLARPPALEAPRSASLRLRGWVGERLEANTRGWLLTAPDANPAMLGMLRDRDREPRRDLVPWAGEFAGKYLTSAALALRLTGDRRLKRRLAAFVKELAAAQDADGYLGPFPRDLRMTGPGLWDLWGQYHCMLGLLLYARETGDPEAMAACLRTADLFCRTFLDGDRRVLHASSEEMNQSCAHVFALLYQETGEERYLRLLREIERDWETPPSGDYVRASLAGKPFHQTPKPRWESLHAVQAVAELYFITGEERYRRAFEQIWRSIRDGDRHNTGGFSSGEQATGNPYDPRAIETCCTVAWSALCVDLLRMTGDSRAADELELSLYNAVLGAQSATGRWWTYNTPMDGERKASAHDIVFQARAGSPELNCCSVNGPRALALLADWAVMETPDGAVVNYYGPGAVSLNLASGGRLTLTQSSRYPQDGRVRLRVGLAEPRSFTLGLRIPHWSARTHVKVAGVSQPEPEPGRYLLLSRRWSPGDEVELELDFAPRVWVGERECAGKLSVYRGPLLLAYDPRFDSYPPDEVPPLDPSALRLRPVGWKQRPLPFGLWQVQAADGRPVTLCDFASASATGTRYRTWLPATW